MRAWLQTLHPACTVAQCSTAQHTLLRTTRSCMRTRWTQHTTTTLTSPQPASTPVSTPAPLSSPILPIFLLNVSTVSTALTRPSENRTSTAAALQSQPFNLHCVDLMFRAFRPRRVILTQRQLSILLRRTAVVCHLAAAARDWVRRERRHVVAAGVMATGASRAPALEDQQVLCSLRRLRTTLSPGIPIPVNLLHRSPPMIKMITSL